MTQEKISIIIGRIKDSELRLSIGDNLMKLFQEQQKSILEKVKEELRHPTVDSARESQYKEGIIDATQRAITIVNEALRKHL